MPPVRRRSLMDAGLDPLTAKRMPAPAQSSPMKPRPTENVPVVLKVAIGLLLGFAGGFVLGRFSRWL